MSTKKGKKERPKRPYSGLRAHKRQKKTLVPPLMAIPGVTLQSWVDDRLPEMLWAALLISQMGRDEAIPRFREAAAIVPEFPENERGIQPTLSSLAALKPDTLERLLTTISSGDDAKNALRPLLLFDELPARGQWATAIGQTAKAEDWESAKRAVLRTLDHQSPEATDCRWLRVLFQVLSGKLHLQTEEQAREILDYPNFGNPQKVRPSVRCMEGMIDGFSAQRSAWSRAFWAQCLNDTPCEPKHTLDVAWDQTLSTTKRRVREVREALARHEGACLRTTDTDARRDAVFGIAAYSLALLSELLSMGSRIAILGRLGLRTLLELYVTILFLKTKDDPDLWTAYRRYGSGQAKLAFLKLDDSPGGGPGSIDVGVLNQLANEDRWLELVPMDLRHWAALDLRKLSEQAGAKTDYDRFYPWTSAFTHGNWAAVRNSCFDLCTNPLHRLHRRLRPDTAQMGDVVADGCELVDKILAALNDLYPGFPARVTLPKSSSNSASVSATGDGVPPRQAESLASIQGEMFQILDEFFRLATGRPAEDFAPTASFTERVREEAEELGRRGPQAHLYAQEALRVFYERFANHLFSGAKRSGGLKLVLGGTSHFGKSQLNSVRKMLLYADSVLVPDPILPWIESARMEERFRSIRFLEAVFFLLHLKPIVDADLSGLRILVFPSFEKSLEDRDPVTQSGIGILITRVLSHHLGRRFESFEELEDFAATRESDFLAAVDRAGLFVAPGGPVGQPLREALRQYVEENRRWRSRSYQEAVKDLPNGLLVLTGLAERLTPQYHLFENAQEMSACPMIALPAPWHYYTILSKLFATEAQARGYLGGEEPPVLSWQSEPPNEWLGDVPIGDLVELLANEENMEFRSRLGGLASELRKAPVTSVGEAAIRVRRGLVSLLEGHQNQINALLDKYRPRFGDARVGHYLTKGPTCTLTLAPRVWSSGGETAAGQPQHGGTSGHAADKPANSMIGVLSLAGRGGRR